MILTYKYHLFFYKLGISYYLIKENNKIIFIKKYYYKL